MRVLPDALLFVTLNFAFCFSYAAKPGARALLPRRKVRNTPRGTLPLVIERPTKINHAPNAATGNVKMPATEPKFLDSTLDSGKRDRRITRGSRPWLHPFAGIDSARRLEFLR